MRLRRSPPCVGVGERDEQVADLEFDRLDLEEVVERVGAGGCRRGDGGRRQRRIGARLRLLGIGTAREHGEADRDADERHLRQPRDEPERGDHPGGELERLGIGRDLVGEHRADLHAFGGVGHHDAGGGGDDEGRDLRDQALTDGEDGELGGGVEKREALLRHADDDAADDVHRGDEQRGDGVALHEARGAVHGAEEVGLATDRVAADPGLGGVDRAVRELAVDRHLLPGQGIEGEAGRDLGHAPRALRDHDEVDRDQDQEED
jgi:hypothetical protein